MSAYIDSVQDLACEEKNGVIRSLTRLAIVNGLTAANCGYRTLWQALTNAGIPLSGSRLDSDGSEFADLILVKRGAKIQSDPSWCHVTLGYEHPLDGPNQDLDNPLTGGMILSKHRASVQQVTVNSYIDPDTGQRTKIEVSHTWPNDDKTESRRGKTDTQTGEIHVYVPQMHVRFEGFVDTTTPELLEQKTIATVNKNFWLNAAPRRWMCTDCQWEAMRSRGSIFGAIPRYRFQFEFQFNADGWDPTAVFIDDRTGKPPAGLVEGTGYKTIRYAQEVDYFAVFHSFFEGFQQVE